MKKAQIPVVYKFFKKNKESFLSYIEEIQPKFHEDFLENYENVYQSQLENVNLSFMDNLVKVGIVAKKSRVYSNVVEWLQLNKKVAPEDILVLPNNYNDAEAVRKWSENRPKLTTRLTAEEAELYKGLKNYEVYAERYLLWIKSMPTLSPILIKDFDTILIKNALTWPDLSPVYTEAFKRILARRGEITEDFTVLKITTDCGEAKK